jgi:single-strand DNA-binding protein
MTTRRATMNVVTLIGDLATDVEVRAIDGERKVASFLIAVDRHGKSGGADFVRVAAWNKEAERCARHLGKGKRVAIDGRLRSRSWEEPGGKRRTSVEVVASSVQFLSLAGDLEKVKPFETPRS